MSKRAIFLGSFNPPHKGHYDVINSVIESTDTNVYLNIELNIDYHDFHKNAWLR